MKKKLYSLSKLFIACLGMLSSNLYAQLDCSGNTVDVQFTDYNTSASSILNSYVSQSIYIDNDFIVDETMIFTGCNIYLGSDVKMEVVGANTLSFNNCAILPCDDSMWGGIYVQNPQATVFISGSKVHHGINGVYSENGGMFYIYDTEFQGNHVGINVKNYENVLSCEIIGNQFKPNLSGGATFTLLPNSLGLTETLAGIDINTVEDVTIGDLSGLQNTFQQLKYGIRSKSCDVHIFNNAFEVPNNSYGVFTQQDFDENVYNLELSNCLFNSSGNSNYGIYSRRQTSTIYLNEMNGLTQGIHCDDMHTFSLIMTNIISDSELAIDVNNVIPNSAMVTGVFANTLNDNYGGVRATNIPSSPMDPGESLYINNNQINAYMPGWLGSQYGVQVNNCDEVTVGYNDIAVSQQPGFLNPVNLNQRGIQVSETQDAQIVENTIYNAGTSIWTAGSCLNTNYACNKMMKYGFGLYFLEQSSTTATEITDQGAAVYYPTDNVWLNNLPDVRMYGAVISATNWYHRGDILSSQVYSPLELEELSVFNIDYVPNIGDATIDQCSGFNGIGEGYLAYPRELKLGDIVRDEIEREHLNEEFGKKAKKYAYSTLKRRPELLNLNDGDDIVFQSFYDLVMESNIGKFNTIFDKMDEREVMEALQLNAEIIAEDLMDENQKIVNHLYLEKYVQDLPFTDEERTALENIATLTPYIGGEAVYSARVMVDLWPEEIGVAYRSGVDTHSGYEFSDVKDNFRLYPNPANDVITIRFDEVKSLEGLSFSIYNSVGQEVLKEEITINDVHFSIDVSKLQAGVYFYHLNRNGENILKNRLVIID